MCTRELVCQMCTVDLVCHVCTGERVCQVYKYTCLHHQGLGGINHRWSRHLFYSHV